MSTASLATSTIAPAIYQRIDNNVYNVEANNWWSADTVLHLLKSSVNPWRVGYAKRKFKELGVAPKGKTALEVGCGGGILTEEIARMGFTTTGVDPSQGSLVTARKHAEANGLDITYEHSSGESLPYADASFDVIFCCDVLEHVRDLPKVIAEINRVLKPGGTFVFDTLNRTFVSKLVAIKIWQEWKRWAFMPPNLHVWEMFIKPEELKALLGKKGFKWHEFQGSKPSISIPTMLKYLRKRVKGEWTYKELGQNFMLVEDKDMNILYAGIATKPK
jgi:2-polyprenyl-6-hydroxyphenyl methylase/3-demethylubiquinone-9 3-methyltransferase